MLPPGPIYNDSFYTRQNPSIAKEEKNDPVELIIKPGLQLNIDYRGVNFEVWNLLQKIYGGGPLIVREELDIYSKDIKDEYVKDRKEESPVVISPVQQVLFAKSGNISNFRSNKRNENSIRRQGSMKNAYPGNQVQ